MELIEKGDWEWRWWWKIGLFEEDEKNKFLFFSLFLLFCSQFFLYFSVPFPFYINLYL
jgi:hypothetical protein